MHSHHDRQPSKTYKAHYIYISFLFSTIHIPTIVSHFYVFRWIRHLPPVRWRLRSDDELRLIKRLQYLLRERALLRIHAVLLELRRAARAENDAILWRQHGVVLAPAQRDLRQAKIVFLLRRKSVRGERTEQRC